MKLVKANGLLVFSNSQTYFLKYSYANPRSTIESHVISDTDAAPNAL